MKAEGVDGKKNECVCSGISPRKVEAKESVFTFEPEQRRRLRIPLDCRIRHESRMNVHCSAGVAAYGDTLEYENCEQTNHI